MDLSPVVVAVDGGGTKTDVAAVRLDGSLVGRVRGPGSNPQVIGLAPAVRLLGELVQAAAGDAPIVASGLFLSGLDLPREVAAMTAALDEQQWAVDPLIDNDLFALLRTGTAEPDAVAVICGTGINAVGVRADGARVRFPALGQISGDWGGGSGIGAEALWHVARATDGRGPATALTEATLETLQAGSVPQLIEELHFGERDWDQLNLLAPVVLRLGETDEVAASLVDRQAAEIVTLAATCLRRLDLLERPVPVVLGGGIIAGGYPRLMSQITAGLTAAAPAARQVALTHRPVVGATLLTLAHAGAGLAALDAAERAVAAAKPTSLAVLEPAS